MFDFQKFNTAVIMSHVETLGHVLLLLMLSFEAQTAKEIISSLHLTNDYKICMISKY